MSWDDLQRATNRAFELTLDWKKLFFTFVLLLIGGWVMVVCRGLAINANGWATLCLRVLPIYVTAAVAMAGGVVLVRIYHDQVKQKPVEYRQVIFSSWHLMVTAASIVMGILLVFFGIWISLGLFHALLAIPVLGSFFSVILAFGPFLLNVSAILLLLGTLAILFYFTPILALKGVSRGKLSQTVRQRLSDDYFSNVIELVWGILPFLASLAVVVVASCLNWRTGFTSANPHQAVMQLFFIMVPLMGLLAPGVIFFFNFATEAHVAFQSRQHEGTGGHASG